MAVVCLFQLCTHSNTYVHAHTQQLSFIDCSHLFHAALHSHDHHADEQEHGMNACLDRVLQVNEDQVLYLEMLRQPRCSNWIVVLEFEAVLAVCYDCYCFCMPIRQSIQ